MFSASPLPRLFLSFLLPPPNTRENWASNTHHSLQYDLDTRGQGRANYTQFRKAGRNAPEPSNQDPSFVILQNQPLKDRQLEMAGIGSLARRQEQLSLMEEGMEWWREKLENESGVDGSQGLRI